MADAVAATIAAGERGVPGTAYNIGGGSRVSMNDVMKIIERIAGHPLKVRREDAQKGDMRDTYADTSLARKDLGFAPKVSLEEGIQAEYRWLASVAGARMKTKTLQLIAIVLLAALAGACTSGGPKKPPTGTLEPDKFLCERGTENLEQETLARRRASTSAS